MIPKMMTAVLLTGHGGFDKLVLRHDVPVPEPGEDQVLIRVSAAGVNNTDINTRIGWYSKSVRGATNDGGENGFEVLNNRDAAWTGRPLNFPLIQGADVCGRIVAQGPGVTGRIGQRVLVAPMMPTGDKPFAIATIGSELDGGFAQYCIAPSVDTYAVECDWDDVELASIPCAYSTAENALRRAALMANETILLTGASGGVGSAAVQLARRRGARVVAVCGAAKSPAIQALGADVVIDRQADLLGAIERESIDVVLDVVAGPQWPQLLQALKPGGRYITVGAIAGPLVELDLRTLYLKDLTLLGCTYQPRQVFMDLVGYIKRGEISPLVAATYPLSEIVAAQKAFLEKNFVGKIVLEVG